MSNRATQTAFTLSHNHRDDSGTELFKYHSTRHDISLDNRRGVSRGVSAIHLDGKALQVSNAKIASSDDGANHNLEVVVG